MRLARKLFLLTAMALAALAMSATTASATGDIEVHEELEGAHCNPCDIVAIGESQLTIPVPPFIVGTCEETFHAEIYEDGEGHITELLNAGHNSQPCTTRKCNGVGEPAAETEWPFHLEEVSGEERIEFRFCLDSAANPNGTGNHCNAVGHVENLGDHHYEITMGHTCPNGITVNGMWEIQNSPIEIEHPEDA